MLKISDAVNKIIYQDEIALEAMRQDLLNFSAYAEQIKSKVENLCFKDVQAGSIVVALSRLASKIQNTQALKPQIILDDLSLKSDLCDITFEKSKKTLRQINKFKNNLDLSEHDFFTTTQSVSEITVILDQDYQKKLLKNISAQPKSIFKNLVAITMRFDEKYLEIPNVIYALLSPLAIKRINLTEVVSTYTELTVVLKEQDMQTAIDCLQGFLKK